MALASVSEARPPEGELSGRELFSHRLLLGLGCIVIVVLGLMHRRFEPELVDPWSARLTVAGMLAATLWLSYVHRRPVFRYVMYAAGYVVTVWIVWLSVLNAFDVRFAMGLMVAVPAISMVFHRRRYLFWYCFSTILLVGLAAWITPQARIPLPTYLTYLFTLALVCYFILGARIKTREELALSEERFRMLVQSVKDYGIFLLDPDGHVMSWNVGAQRIKGYRPDEILGRHLSVFYPDDAVEAGRPREQLEVAVSEGRAEDEGWRVRKGDGLYWANAVTTALRDETGELIGFTKIIRDLSERRAAEKRAIEDARRIAEAEAASRAKSQFLAALSHELRTPLNAIGGYVELLVLGIQGPVNEKQTNYLERIKTSQRHLLAIINELLHFSRIEAGEVTYAPAPMPLSAAVEAVRPLIEPQAEKKQIRLEWPAVEEWAVAKADLTKVHQILINLLTNALKFTPRGGAVRVSQWEEQDRVGLDVRDTGPGIAAENLEHIFDPFVQVGRSLASPHEGTGLGLAISRDLARGMGGELTVRSTVGEGSTFSLELPRARQTAPLPGGDLREA